jgi:hypothetical protein
VNWRVLWRWWQVQRAINREAAMGKPWYLSKTVWVNVIALAAVLVQAYTGENLLDAQGQAALLAVVNLVLRIFFTREGLR